MPAPTTQETPAYLNSPGSSKKPLTLREKLDTAAQKGEFARALPKHLSVERFTRVAITALTRVPNLAQCTQESFFKCLLDLSMYGLEPDGRRAHLIPFKNNKANTYECTLIIDYKGLAELALRSGLIAKLHADVVCENDIFTWDRGVIQEHHINFKGDRGAPYAAYAYAETKDGAVFCEVLTKEEIYAIRDKSQGWNAFKKGWAKQSPWDPKDPGSEREMMKKTAFRRLSKWLPLSAEFRDATEMDNDDYIDISAQALPEPKAPRAALTAPAEDTATAEAAQTEQPQDEPIPQAQESQAEPQAKEEW